MQPSEGSGEVPPLEDEGHRSFGSNTRDVSREDRPLSSARSTADMADIRQVPSEELDIANDYSMFAELEQLRDNQEELRRELDNVEESCQEVVLWNNKDEFHRLVESAFASPSAEDEVVRGHHQQKNDLVRVFLSQTATLVWERGGGELSPEDLQTALSVDDRHPLPVERTGNDDGMDEIRETISRLVAASVDEDTDMRDLRKAWSANFLHLAETISADNCRQRCERMRSESETSTIHCDSVYHHAATVSTEDDPDGIPFEPVVQRIKAMGTRFRPSEYDLLATITVDEAVTQGAVHSMIGEPDLSDKNSQHSKPSHTRSFLWACFVTLGKILHVKKPTRDDSVREKHGAHGKSVSDTRAARHDDESQPLLQSY